jgi:hypothetical protein
MAEPTSGAGRTASKLQAAGEKMMNQHGFLGVPVETFADAGRRQFIALLNQGLNPESLVLDLGCGCLRTGAWLIRFLEPGGYHGIEPARQRIEFGLQYLLTKHEINLKEPRFDFNPDFDSSVFGVSFDFFLAGSIWSHASKGQIQKSLDSFDRDSTASGVFLSSYIPANSLQDDYQGDSWVGTSHKSNVPGVIKHSLEWIEQQCAVRGLRVDQLPGEAFDQQLWLRVRRRQVESCHGLQSDRVLV